MRCDVKNENLIYMHASLCQGWTAKPFPQVCKTDSKYVNNVKKKTMKQYDAYHPDRFSDWPKVTSALSYWLADRHV